MAAMWEPVHPDKQKEAQPPLHILALASVPVGEGADSQQLCRGSEYVLPADQANRLLTYGLAMAIDDREQKPSRWIFALRSLLLRLGFTPLGSS
jgi:hypothetical protein